MRTHSSRMDQQSEPNWQLDRQQFFFRVNFIHHELYHQIQLPQKTIRQSQANNDGRTLNRLVFLIITEKSLTAPWREEFVSVLDNVLDPENCGLPLPLPSQTHAGTECVPFPVLSTAARAELSSRVPEWALENLCSSLCVGPGPESQSANPANVRYFIRVPPLVKYIILARIGIVASVVVARSSLRAPEEQYDCVTVSSLLLLQIKALANGFRMFVDRDGEGEWTPVLDRVISEVGDALFSALDKVLCSRGGWTSEILLTSLYTLNTDWADRLPREWVTRMKSVTENASAFHGARPSSGLYSNQTWNWFGVSTDENWTERVRWLAAVCEQQTDRRLVKVCVREEFDFIAEHIPYILFRIVPRELLSLLRRALDVAHTKGDQRMLDEALHLVSHILAITNCTLQRGLERTHHIGTESTWDGKNFAELFLMSMPYFHQWCGFEVGDDYNRLEYRPLPGIADSYGSLLTFLQGDAAPFLTEYELGHFSSDVEFYIDCFNTKVPDIEGPRTLRFLTNFKKKRFHFVDTSTDVRALGYHSAESNSYSGLSSDPETSSLVSDCSDSESEQNLPEADGEIRNFSSIQPSISIAGVSNLKDLAELIDQQLFRTTASTRAENREVTQSIRRNQLNSESRRITDSDTSETTNPNLTTSIKPNTGLLEDLASSSLSDSQSENERFRQAYEIPISSGISEHEPESVNSI